LTPLDHQAAALALETTRIAAALIVAPMPVQNAPNRARGAVALLLALVAHSTTAANPPLFDAWLKVVLAAPAELLLGAAMGLTLRIAIGSVETAADTIGPLMGFGTASLFDPRTAAPESALGRLLRTFAMLLAVIVGAHRIVVGALVASFRAIPVGAAAAPSATALDLLTMAGDAIRFGLVLALPVCSCSAKRRSRSCRAPRRRCRSSTSASRSRPCSVRSRSSRRSPTSPTRSAASFSASRA